MPLDPEAAAWLERQAGLPSRGSLTIAETRAAYLRMSRLTAETVPVAHVEDAAIAPGLNGRLYSPSDDPGLPILVWFHGGRFISGSLETHDALCRLLAQAGERRVLSVDYRLAPENPFPAAVEDSLTAIKWAFAKCSRVGVGGDSAGGNLAAVAAFACARSNRIPLTCQLLVYPMLDPACGFPSHREFGNGYGPASADMQRGWREYLAGDATAGDECISPLFAENLAGLPSAFVLTAEFDCLRDEGEEYAQRLARSGVSVNSKRYDGMIHGFFQMPAVISAAREAIRDAGMFLKMHL